MTDIEIYFDSTQKPWGRLFYQILWEQLSFARNMSILDFGSGFGITSNYMAADNDVMALEPNEKMCEMRIQNNEYQQVLGGIEYLHALKDKQFDLILCHNVLEYLDDREEVFGCISGLLKKDGVLSIVKHNHLGRVMQKAVFDNDASQAVDLLNGKVAYAQSFGEIRYYDLVTLYRLAEKYSMRVADAFGIRTFFALYPDNSVKYSEDWIDAMFVLEKKASNIDAFKNIAFFNHIIFKKL